MTVRKLGMPGMYIELEVRDRSGKLIRKYRQPARTWVKNFMILLYGGLTDTTTHPIKTDGGTSNIQSTVEYGEILKVTAPAGDDQYGLVVGKGTKPYDPNDYCLDNQIANGTGADQLSYGEVTVEEPIDTGTKLVMRIIRIFTNNSGGNITVTEVGLIMFCSNVHILVARDVLAQAVTVPDGSTLTARYILEVAYA